MSAIPNLLAFGGVALSLDDCSHCACSTELIGFKSAADAIEALERGETGCDNCMEDQDEHPDGHTRCVALFDADGNVLWDGRHR